MVKDGMQQGGGRGGNGGGDSGASASAGVVHCQVKKIKQEDIVEKSMEQGPMESRRTAAGFRGLSRQMSRSPLGRTGQPIPVGD